MTVDPQVRAFYEAKLKNNGSSNNSSSNSLRSAEPSDEDQQQKDLELVAALRKNAAALAPAADCGGAALCRVLFDLSDPVRVLYIVDL